MNDEKIKRVAIFVSNLGGGGAEKVMVTLANGLAARGLEVHLIAARAVGVNLETISENVRLHDFNVKKVTHSIVKLKTTIHLIEPDAVLACANMPSFLICTLRLLQQINCRVVISERAVLSITLQNAPIVVRFVFPVLVRLLYNRADKIITVSDDVAVDLISKFDIPKDKIKTVYNPIIPHNIRQNEWKPKAIWGRKYILAVGRLHKQKNYPALLRAFARLKDDFDCRLLVLGVGPEKSKLEMEVKELNLRGRVLFLGYRSKPELWMKRALVYVSASNWEGLPGATIQAINEGVPAVVTNCSGGISDVTENGELATLVAVGNEEVLAEKLRLVIKAVLSGENVPDQNKLSKWRRKFSINDRVSDYHAVLLSEI